MAGAAKLWVLAAVFVSALLACGSAPAARPATDPAREPGSPVQTCESAASYRAGPANHALVGNIDGDSTLEILASAHANGPLYAWNANGSPEPGWAHSGFPGASSPALGQLSASDPGLEVFSAEWDGQFVAYNGAGAILPGWPRPESNYVDTPAALADVNGHGLDEIFAEEQDWYLHGYSATGTVIAGWPSMCDGGQELHTPAIADLDGDGIPEIVSASGSTTPGVYLCAYHRDGTPVAGFPVLLDDSYGPDDTFPVIGDVDGDGAPVIVVITRAANNPVIVKVLSAGGAVERTMTAVGTVPYGSAPPLGHLDGDGG